ncbi:MAG TPA: hypothetical protein VJ063_15700, partial [Verrucomicrobiae bacterium]|nr:hypothetical protein [Verrucomicrobiae bacterium]
MRLKQTDNHSAGFSRADLLICLAAVALLGTVAISVPGTSMERSDSAICANNLRQIGRAFQMWASDHGGQNPWWVHYNDGGSFIGGQPPPGNLLNVPGLGPSPAALRNNTWVQFAYVGQELQTPAVLVCPADRSKVRATSFSNNSSNGLFSANFQNRANSYLIGAHAVSQWPSSLLSGDRSLKEHFVNSSCSANLGVASGISMVPPSAPGWTSDLHPTGGNLL